MTIIELIESDIICQPDNNLVLKVTAVIEDAKLILAHTWVEPPEYGPALCRTEVTLYDEDLSHFSLTTEENIIKFLEENDPEWILNEDDWS